MKLWVMVLKRTFASVVYLVTGALAAGSIAGIELWQAALMAGVTGVLRVAEALSKAYLSDGVIDINEINDTFTEIAKKKK
jgi:hypothetical protein